MSTFKLASALAVGIPAVASQSLTATVDTTAPTTPFRHNWEECVGSGHMLLGTRADWRTHLKLAHDELGFQRIRGHGLLDDDMSAVPGGKVSVVNADGTTTKQWKFSFYNVDQVFDYLLSIDMTPVVELSFMPSHFVDCGNDCHYAFGDNGGYKGLIMPPDHPEDWYELVNALAQHLVDRYGLDEVKKWNFEVWNELWGVAFPEPYMTLFNASSRALKDVDPSLRVGGPATMQTQYVPEFIANATAAKIPFDFVSTHFYPTDPECEIGAKKTDEDCFVDMVGAAQAAAEAAGYPFYLTEYNNGLGQTSRDDSSASAFVFRMMGEVQKLDIFSWWTFSDVFEEGWMQSAPFHNGYGAMTVHGTRKPVWRAFQALHAAGTARYNATTPQSTDRNSPISVLATTLATNSTTTDDNNNNNNSSSTSSPCSSSGSALNLALYIASWHRVDAEHFSCDKATKTCKPDPKGTYTDQSLCDSLCESTSASSFAEVSGNVPNTTTTTVEITIKHSATAQVPATAKGCRMDATHANPQAAWISMGSPTYPTKDQIATLDTASELVEEALDLKRVSDTESVLTVHMTEYSALYVVV